MPRRLRPMQLVARCATCEQPLVEAVTALDVLRTQGLEPAARLRTSPCRKPGCTGEVVIRAGHYPQLPKTAREAC